jgi:transcriptional regulator with GAF, ATPase, and Fis domain
MAKQNSAHPSVTSLNSSADSSSPHFALGPGSTSASSSQTSSSKAQESPAYVSAPSTAELESQLIDQTKHQIRALAQEIAELVQSNCEPADFYQGFLTRMTQALASVGGAIWLRDQPEEPLQLAYQINLKQTILATDKQAQIQHTRLLNRLLTTAEPSLVPPHAGTDGSDEAANPTAYLLLIGPLKINGESIGIVEILQRSNAGPTTQQGYLRFVAQMTELASTYLTNQRLATFAKAEAMWQQLESFTRSIHHGLDASQIAYTIANEGRRLAEVDRVSVALGAGGACRIAAVSGLDSIERRAEQVKRLAALTAAVIRTREPLWYDGDDGQLPPQIERKLHEYVDKSHCKMLAIIPLKQNHLPAEANLSDPRIHAGANTIGAIIVEQLKDSQVHPALRQRIETVAQHSEIALTNALEHQAIFLLPLWKAIGQITQLFRGTKLMKTVAVIAVLIGSGFFLTCFPYRFGLNAAGSLIPARQFEVFAEENGVLEEVLVSDTGDSMVKRGDLLARMYNNDLDVEIENLAGQIKKKKELLTAKESMQSRKLDPLDAHQIDSEINTLRQEIFSLGGELDLRYHQRKLLAIRSPADGQVINWQARQNLLRRPVRQGQHLMTIVDPQTTWQVELRLPERRVAHLMRAMRESPAALPVTFGLMSYPGVEFMGQLLFIDQQLDVHADDGNTALVRIGFDNQTIPRELLRSGTRVTAKIHCGNRSIGYVFFHELIETVQSKWLLWF